MKVRFPDASPEERRRLLASLADKIVDDKIYHRELSKEEIRRFEEALAKDSIELARLEEKLRDIKAEYKMEMDPIKEDNKHRIKVLREGRIEESGIVYEFFDDDNFIRTYNEEGMYLGERRATSEDSQTTIHGEMRRISEQ